MRKKLSVLLCVMLLFTMMMPAMAMAADDDILTPEALVEQQEENVLPADQEAVETEAPPAEEEESLPAEDIAPQEDEEPIPEDVTEEDVEEEVAEVDEELAADGQKLRLAATIQFLKEQGRWNARTLVAAARQLKLMTRNHLHYLRNHSAARVAVLRLTDKMVRLAYNRFEERPGVQLVVYKNAAQTYSMLGAYQRAKGVIKLILKLSPERRADYGNLQKLYKKLGDDRPKVFVKGQQPDFDVPPQIINNRTMVPIRAIGESLGAQVNYNAGDGTVNVVNGDANIVLRIGSNKAHVNGREITLDQSATIKDGRTLVPLRFLSEALGQEVTYDPTTRLITVED